MRIHILQQYKYNKTEVATITSNKVDFWENYWGKMVI